MPPLKSRFESPYHCLGINSSASEPEVRAAYRTLALQLHPDKVDENDREDATAQFQELQRAYEICLKRLQHLGPITELDWICDPDADDYSNLRDGTYDMGDGAFWDVGWRPVRGQDWWDNLTEDHPAPLRNWGKACKRAHRNSHRNMTDTERVILNIEFTAAQEEYEAWRRQLELEEQRKQKWTQLNERERRNAEFFQSQKRQEQESGVCNDGYDEDLAAEEEYFRLWDCQDWKFLVKRPQTGTWRDLTPNKIHTKHSLSGNAAKKAAHLQLENFQHQVRALEDRIQTSGEQESIDPDKRTFARHKAKARNETAARLEQGAKVDNEWHRTEKRIKEKLVIAEKEANRKGFELEYRDIPGVENTDLFEMASLKYKISPRKIETGGIMRTDDTIPENWEDAIQ